MKMSAKDLPDPGKEVTVVVVGLAVVGNSDDTVGRKVEGLLESVGKDIAMDGEGKVNGVLAVKWKFGQQPAKYEVGGVAAV